MRLGSAILLGCGLVLLVYSVSYLLLREPAIYITGTVWSENRSLLRQRVWGMDFGGNWTVSGGDVLAKNEDGREPPAWPHKVLAYVFFPAAWLECELRAAPEPLVIPQD